MKHFTNKTILTIVALATLVFFSIGCSDDDTPTETPSSGYDFTEILKNVTDNTIVKTYGNLKVEAANIFTNVENFKTSGSQSDLNKAADSWKAARVEWESTEGFLFGPVSYKNYDPSLDSWPLDQAQLTQVLNSNFELNAEFILEGLGFTLRGFHTIEYLLFREGAPRTAADVTAREKEYLVAVTEVLRDETAAMHSDWVNGFADEFKNAGKAGSRYISQVDAIEELIGGMEIIADEVGNGKIKDPVESQDVFDVESWFSWNSLTDFQNNMRSIENAYTSSGSGASISDFIKSKNATLDTKVKTDINNAIAKIAAIPEPFRNNLTASQAKTAMIACNTLLVTLGEAKKLIKN